MRKLYIVDAKLKFQTVISIGLQIEDVKTQVEDLLEVYNNAKIGNLVVDYSSI